MICRMNWEKKAARAATSPSTRSISSPGDFAVWKAMSRSRAWAARSWRMRLVADQPSCSLK